MSKFKIFKVIIFTFCLIGGTTLVSSCNNIQPAASPDEKGYGGEGGGGVGGGVGGGGR